MAILDFEQKKKIRAARGKRERERERERERAESEMRSMENHGEEGNSFHRLLIRGKRETFEKQCDNSSCAIPNVRGSICESKVTPTIYISFHATDQ